jgi:nucleoside-triphosphatase THEP1
MDYTLADVSSILKSSKTKKPGRPSRYLLTGESSTGKTAWCCKLAESARNSRLTLGGVVSPGRYIGDRRIAIDLQDVNTGETHQLASLRPRIEPDQPTRKWVMDSETISWGNRIFRELGKIDLLIVDEIGPLELIHGKGLLHAIHAIDQGKYGAAVIVVRASLLENILDRWPDSHVMLVPG